MQLREQTRTEGGTSGGARGRVPNKSVLRFAPKAVLTPADLLALQEVAGNQAVNQLIEERKDLTGAPTATSVPIVQNLNDGTTDEWKTGFTVQVATDSGETGEQQADEEKDTGSSSPASMYSSPAQLDTFQAAGHADEEKDTGSSSPASMYSSPAQLDTFQAAGHAEQEKDTGSSSPASMYSSPAQLPTSASAGHTDEQEKDTGSSSPASMYSSPAQLPTSGSAGHTDEQEKDTGSSSPASMYSSPAQLPTSASAAHAGQEAKDTSSSAAPPVAQVPVSAKPTRKYPRKLKRGEHYANEFVDGSPLLQQIVGNMERLVAAGKLASVAAGMMKAFGWSQDDCTKYLPTVANIDTNNPDKPLVAQLKTEEDRRAFQLFGGSTLTQGDGTDPYDTKDSFSKFMGTGFSIYVMATDGSFYAGQHKVGLFHHSSFLAGGAVAGAGEMQVSGGSLRYITNKSGHYLPTAAEMIQVFAELESRGVNLAGVEYTHMTDFNKNNKDKWPGGAKGFYDQYKSNPASIPK